ncbi:MAG: hypothetical protein WAN25_06965, partial [Candidatus Acidiferrum sp.]
ASCLWAGVCGGVCARVSEKSATAAAVKHTTAPNPNGPPLICIVFGIVRRRFLPTLRSISKLGTPSRRSNSPFATKKGRPWGPPFRALF